MIIKVLKNEQQENLSNVRLSKIEEAMISEEAEESYEDKDFDFDDDFDR